MKIRMRDGRELAGTALEIVRAMHDLAFGVEGLTVTEYIGWVVDNVRKFEQLELTVEGTTDEERAAALVDAMIDAGLAERA